MDKIKLKELIKEYELKMIEYAGLSGEQCFRLADLSYGESTEILRRIRFMIDDESLLPYLNLNRDL
jgi:hypothetical protein